MVRFVTLHQWLECTDLPREKCNGYRVRHGLPPLGVKGELTNVPEDKQLKTGCGGCARRKAKLNALAPKLRLGDQVERITTATGIKGFVDRLADRKQTAAVAISPIPEPGRESKYYETSPPAYLTLENLASDTLSLIPRLPSDISVVVGVARSGMAPAATLAMYLHKPLFANDQKEGIVDCGHGWRLGTGKPHRSDPASGTALIVDDTLMTGGSLKQARTIAAKHFPKRLHAHVYVNP